MKTCTTCRWRTTCDLRRSSNAQRCTVWKSDQLSPLIGIVIAAILGSLMWAGLIYAMPLAILAAKGFGG